MTAPAKLRETGGKWLFLVFSHYQPCAWLIGHSEGALVGLEATQTSDDKICGGPLLSGPDRRAGVVLREQLGRQLPPTLMAQADAAVTDLEAGRTTANVPGLEMPFRPSVQPA